MPTDREPREVIVVGAGVAGIRAAETLRKEGFDGALTIVRRRASRSVTTGPRCRRNCCHGEVHRAGIDLALQFDFDARVLR